MIVEAMVVKTSVDPCANEAERLAAQSMNEILHWWATPQLAQ